MSRTYSHSNRQSETTNHRTFTLRWNIIFLFKKVGNGHINITYSFEHPFVSYRV